MRRIRKTSECEHTRALCKRATAIRTLVVPLIGGIGALPGVPDRYFSHLVWSGFIEFKQGTGKLSDRQYNVCRELVLNGDSVYLGRFDAAGNLTIEDPVSRLENRAVLKWSDRGLGAAGFKPVTIEVDSVLEEFAGSGVAGVISPLKLFKALRVLDGINSKQRGHGKI